MYSWILLFQKLMNLVNRWKNLLTMTMDDLMKIQYNQQLYFFCEQFGNIYHLFPLSIIPFVSRTNQDHVCIPFFSSHLIEDNFIQPANYNDKQNLNLKRGCRYAHKFYLNQMQQEKCFSLMIFQIFVSLENNHILPTIHSLFQARYTRQSEDWK